MAFVFHGSKIDVENRISRVQSTLDRSAEYQSDIRRNGDQWKGTLTVHFPTRHKS